MTYPADWLTWAQGVLSGISAPVNDVNLRSLWDWSVNESPAQDTMRWHNPLNTTQNGFGGQSQNSVGVKAYPTVDTGIQATVATLTNGRYPHIIQNLQQSTPLTGWHNAVSEINTWGTHQLAAAIARGITPPAEQLGNPAGGQGGIANTGISPPIPDIPGALASLGQTVNHLGFLLAGLLLFTLGLLLALVPDVLKTAKAIGVPVPDVATAAKASGGAQASQAAPIAEVAAA